MDKRVIDLMKRHDRDGNALVYNTIQAYLKSARKNVVNHLKEAQGGDWTLGNKLVRGAYIANEPREKIHDSKQETDANYNEIVEALMEEGVSYCRKSWCIPRHAAIRRVSQCDKHSKSLFIALSEHRRETTNYLC
jgi:hypothetical protein